MKFEWYLARRYFKGNRNQSRFLSFIKIMAIAGVTIGTAGLLISLSIVHGFKSVINSKIVGYGPHIVVSTYGENPIFRSDTLMTYLDKYSQIEEMQAVKKGQIMLQSRGHISGTLIRGVDESGGLTNIEHFITRGSYDLAEDTTGKPGLIIGASLASDLEVSVGERIIAYTMEGMPSPLNSPDLVQFRVSGVYETGISEFDNLQVIVDKKHIDKLLNLPGAHASAIEIKLKDIDHIKQFDELLYSDLAFPYYTETIYERYANIFAWVNLQEQTIPFVISVMIIVSAFNLIGTILMMVLERTKDIGILKTIGATSSTIRNIFMLEGLYVAGIGLLLGTSLSLLFNWLQSTYQIIPLSQDNYYMAYAPVDPHGLDFIIVALVTIILCGLASYIPARVASNTDPVRTIAYGR